MLVSTPKLRIVDVIASVKQAPSLARSIVEGRLAGGVQLTALDSVYTWQGSVHAHPEVRMSITTTTDRLEALVQHIRDQHSYDCPGVLVCKPDSGTKDFVDWLENSTM